MPQTTGILTKVLPKDTGYFSLKIGDAWYGGGKSAPNAAEGDMVEVTYTSKDVGGKTYHNATAVKVVNKTATVARNAKEAVAAGGNDKDLYWKKKEDRDVANDSKREFGATRNTAVEVVNFAIEKGYLPSLDKAKVQDKFDLYLSIIDGTVHKLLQGTSPKVTPAKIMKASEEDAEIEGDDQDND